MKSFRFGLAPVLAHRRREEESRAQELARAQRSAIEAGSARRRLEGILDGERQAFSGASVAGRAGALRNHIVVLDQLRARIEDAASREAEAREEVVERVVALREASRHRGVLCRLEDRQRGEWQAERKRREQDVSDEAALTRHFRARREEGSR
ncbi:MAG: flagellar export protein FliJ [Gemmatimonadales bacterium]|nr:MAG: flagellar export protein FliJ [Gemmatimonadales bacterium]